MEHTFSAVFEKHGELFIGYVEELPGANTQGKTLEEARQNLKEAIEMVLRANKEIAALDREQTDAVREPIKVTIE